MDWVAQQADGEEAGGGGKRRRVAGAEASEASDRFRLSNQQFNQQYASVYYCRLQRLRPDVQRAAIERWQDAELCERISSLSQGRASIVVGTLYKVMKLKPSILDEYKKKSTAAAIRGVTRACLVSPTDSLVMEDDSGRVQLQLLPGVAARHPVDSFVSGAVVAVRGRENQQGQFAVDDLLFPGLAPQPSPRARAPGPGPRYVALVSGLSLGLEEADPLAAQLLVDFLAGAAGGGADHAAASRVVRVVVAGNSLHEQVAEEGAQYRKRKSGVDRLVRPLRELDALLAQVAASAPVDLLPGATDPANYTVPQQPLHHCLFPLCRTYPGFRLLTNPATVGCAGGVRLTATAGQAQLDMARFSTCEDAAELVERTLRWRHLAPSAPDTLACYPFQDRDPFVVEETPHVLAAGNQPAFSTRLVRDGDRACRAVAVPSFARTQSFVLVDIASDDLECHEVHLPTPAFEARRAAEAAAAAKEKAAADDDDDEDEDEEVPEPDGGDDGAEE